MFKKIIKNGFIASLSFYIVLIVSLPRESLWFKFEEFLQSSESSISGERVSDGLISIKVEDGEIVASGMSVANFESGDITPLLFYNRIDILNLKIGEDLKQFGDISLDKLTVEHSVIQPIKVMLNGAGSIGEFKGRVNILERTVDILLFPSPQFQKMRAVMKHFKKHENGGYVYNGKF